MSEPLDITQIALTEFTILADRQHQVGLAQYGDALTSETLVDGNEEALIELVDTFKYVVLGVVQRRALEEALGEMVTVHEHAGPCGACTQARRLLGWWQAPR